MEVRKSNKTWQFFFSSINSTESVNGKTEEKGRRKKRIYIRFTKEMSGHYCYSI